MAWGDVNSSGGSGNYVAIGTFKPGIEIWNLDVLSALEPTCILGGEDLSEDEERQAREMMEAYKAKKEGKKGKAAPPPTQGEKEGKLYEGSHTDAVMCLDWSKLHRNLVLSGSADSTVKLWDVTSPHTPLTTFEHHTDKVSAVAFHPTDGHVYASGGFDKCVCVVDARTSDSARRASHGADVEEVAWDPTRPHLLTAAGEDGMVKCWDVRSLSSPLWTLDCGASSSLAFNANVAGMMSVVGEDKEVKIYDTHAEGGPRCVIRKDGTVGKLYTTQFYESGEMLVGFGGTGGQVSGSDVAKATS